MPKGLLSELRSEKQEISLSFKNLTSESPSLDVPRLISLKDKGCIISLPAKSCSIGHQVFLCFMTKEKASHRKIEVIGKVMEVMKIDDSFIEVSIQFHQFQVEEWQEMLRVFEQKQEVVTATLNKLR